MDERIDTYGDAKKIEDTLKDMNLDKGSIIGLITNDNKEFIISDSSAQFSFINQTFFQNIRKENTNYKPGDIKLNTILLNGVHYRSGICHRKNSLPIFK